MFTMEQKVNLVLRYIATTDDTQRDELKSRIVEALNEDATIPTRNALDIDDVIADFMKEVGVPARLLGYNYTACAIKLVLSDDTYIRTITSRLYPDIARKYGTTSSRVERAIRHAVEIAFDRCDWDTIYGIFGNTISPTKGRPTNSEFIKVSANAVSRIMKNRSVEVA